jgi:histone H3/H4
MVMAVHVCDAAGSGEGEGPGGRDEMRAKLGPHVVDQLVRQAISVCWMVVPDEKRTVKDVEAEVRRVVERALENLRQDAASFGFDV